MVLRSPEEAELLAAARKYADREYSRGLDVGLAVAEAAVLWLGSTRGGGTRPAFTHAKVAEMIKARIAHERNRER